MSGEVSLATRNTWQEALCGLVERDSDVLLEMSELSFVDVAGAALLASAASRLGEGHRVLVSRAPTTLRCTLELFWPDQHTIEATTR